MCQSIGVDLVRVGRIEEAVAKFGERFLKRIYTEVELAYCLPTAHKFERLAGRFAAKEAASKALGTGLVGVSWKDFEVRNLPSGKPNITLTGRASDIADALGYRVWTVTIAHEREFAVAVVTAG
jgi:holo-[acyl-carrier protein] synthase